jgi:acyl-coenzyme A synthetase/AMP-(fatty) acid ligase
MGDLGRFDAAGRLWFCGRHAEYVQTSSGPLYPDCCEAIVNQNAKVFRSALIDSGNGIPALVIEPEREAFPTNRDERLAFARELRMLCAENPITASIEHFFFEKEFPVDVRHNAKIHRLSLAKKWQGQAKSKQL